MIDRTCSIAVVIVFLFCRDNAISAQDASPVDARQFGSSRGQLIQAQPSQGASSMLDDWTPIGTGDPLKNDPTFQYAPPILARSRPLTANRNRLRPGAFGWPYRTQERTDYNHQAQRRYDQQPQSSTQFLTSAEQSPSLDQTSAPIDYPWQKERVEAPPSAQFRPPTPSGHRHQSLQFHHQQRRRQQQQQQQQSTVHSQVPEGDRLFAGVSSLHQQRRRLQQPSQSINPATASLRGQQIGEQQSPESTVTETRPSSQAVPVNSEDLSHVFSPNAGNHEHQQQWNVNSHERYQQNSQKRQQGNYHLDQRPLRLRPADNTEQKIQLQQPHGSGHTSHRNWEREGVPEIQAERNENIFTNQKNRINIHQIGSQRTPLNPVPLTDELVVITSTEKSPQKILSPFDIDSGDNFFQPINFESVKVQDSIDSSLSWPTRDNSRIDNTVTSEPPEQGYTAQSFQQAIPSEATNKIHLKKESVGLQNFSTSIDDDLEYEGNFPLGQSSSLIKIPWLSQALGLFSSIPRRPQGFNQGIGDSSPFSSAAIETELSSANKNGFDSTKQDSWEQTSNRFKSPEVPQTSHLEQGDQLLSYDAPLNSKDDISITNINNEAGELPERIVNIRTTIRSPETSVTTTTTTTTASTTTKPSKTSPTTTTTTTTRTTTTTEATTTTTTTEATTTPLITSTNAVWTAPPRTIKTRKPFFSPIQDSRKQNKASPIADYKPVPVKTSALFDVLEQRTPYRKWKAPNQRAPSRYQSHTSYDETAQSSEQSQKRRPTLNLQSLLKNRSPAYGSRRRVPLSSLLDKNPGQETTETAFREPPVTKPLVIETDFIPVTTSRKGLLIRRSTTASPAISPPTAKPFNQRTKFSSLNRKRPLRRRPVETTTTTIRASSQTPTTTEKSTAGTTKIIPTFPDESVLDLALSATDFRYKTVKAPPSYTNRLEQSHYAPFPISKIHRNSVSRPVIMVQSPTSYTRIKMFGVNHGSGDKKKDHQKNKTKLKSKEVDQQRNDEIRQTSSENTSAKSVVDQKKVTQIDENEMIEKRQDEATTKWEPIVETTSETPKTEHLPPTTAGDDKYVLSNEETEDLFNSYINENTQRYQNDKYDVGTELFSPYDVMGYSDSEPSESNFSTVGEPLETSAINYNNANMYSRLAYLPLQPQSDYLFLDDDDNESPLGKFDNTFTKENAVETKTNDDDSNTESEQFSVINQDEDEPAFDVLTERSDSVFGDHDYQQFDDEESLAKPVSSESAENHLGSASSWMTGLLSSLFGPATRAPNTVLRPTANPMGALLTDILGATAQVKSPVPDGQDPDEEEHTSEWHGGFQPPAVFSDAPALAGLFASPLPEQEHLDDEVGDLDTTVPELQDNAVRPVFFTKRHRLSHVTESGPVVKVSRPFEYMSTLRRFQDRLPPPDNDEHIR